jgi:hypothetical protein
MEMDPEVQLMRDPAHHKAMSMIRDERRRQMVKWGEQNHPDGTGSVVAEIFAEQWKTVCDANHEASKDDWATIAAEEFLEALAETDEDLLIIEVAQNAAVFTAWLEDLLRRQLKRMAETSG